MAKRLLILSGIATLGVVINHAAGWGFTAMFAWTDRYLPVVVPNFDQLGTWPYYVLVILRQLTTFSLPVFLFVSGYFTAYAFKGLCIKSNWNIIKMRLIYILVPYLVWSMIIYLSDFIFGNRYFFSEYVQRIITGQVIGPFFYIPVICQFYILSPILGWLAKFKWKILIVGSILIQLSILAWHYLYLLEITNIRPLPQYIFLNWLLFYALGAITGYHINSVKQILSRFKSIFGLLLVILGISAVIIPIKIAQITGDNGWLSNVFLLSVCLYSVFFILWYIANNHIHLPLGNKLAQLGKQVFGIYLIHPLVMIYISKFIYHFTPKLLAYQIIYQPILVFSSIAIPIVMMNFVNKSRMRKYYRYCFG